MKAKQHASLFYLVGIWWAGWAQLTFSRLPKMVSVPLKKGNIFTDGFKEVKKVYAEVKKMPVLKRFLRGFFFYSMGVQTVMHWQLLYLEANY